MNNAKSKQLMRVPNTEEGRKFLRTFRNELNKARYSIRVRGRKPDKHMMDSHNLKSNHFSRDGSIPFKFATEFAVYVEGIDTPNGTIIHKAIEQAVEQSKVENDNFKARLRMAVASLKKFGAEVEELREERDESNGTINKLRTEVVKLRLELGTMIHVKAMRGVMISNLEEDNEILKQRVDDREGTIHVLKHRIDARGGTIEDLRQELDTMRRVASALDKKNKEKVKHINRLKREYHTVRCTLHYVDKLFNGGK